MAAGLGDGSTTKRIQAGLSRYTYTYIGRYKHICKCVYVHVSAYECTRMNHLTFTHGFEMSRV